MNKIKMHRKKLIVNFILLMTVSVSYAQQPDSLVEVFPLNIGNSWLYQYHYAGKWSEPPCERFDTGKVEMKIVGNNSFGDTLVWQIQEHQTFQVHYISPYEYIDTTYSVDTTIGINLYEIQHGQHHLFIQDHGSLIFSLVDTGKIYRYQPVDSSGNIIVIGYDGNFFPGYGHELVFHREQGITIDSEWQSTFGTISYLEKTLNLISSTLVGFNDTEISLPQALLLMQNYPNPFNPTTVINYQLPTKSFVTLKVYDVLGREVATLVNEHEEAGYYKASFNAVRLSSGVYFYKLQAGNIVATKKMLLAR